MQDRDCWNMGWNGHLQKQCSLEHGDHTWDLLLLMEARVIRLRFKVPGHRVIHPGEDLQDFQALSKLDQEGREGLHKPEPLSGFLHEE